MITPTPQYVHRSSDHQFNRRYLGGVLVDGIRGADDLRIADLHIDGAVSSIGAEVLFAGYRMSPMTARRLAAALVEVADHVDKV